MAKNDRYLSVILGEIKIRFFILKVYISIIAIT